MSIPKEPRQLMINIMYLVLTALLALNVSAEIFNAFDMVDKGLVSANNSLDEKNALLPSAIKDGAKKNEALQTYADRVDVARELSSSLTAEIDAIVDHMVDEAGDKDGTPHSEGDYKEDAGKRVLRGQKNYDVTTRYLVDEGKGEELKEKMLDYKQKFLELIDEDERESFASKIPIEIDDESWKTSNTKRSGWADFNFSHMPLSATLPIFTKFKNDIKSSEATVLNYLMNKVGGGENIIFDKYKVVSAPQSTYVIKGETFSTDVFLSAAAGEGNNVGVEIFVGGNKLRTDDEGVAKYSVKANSVGKKSYNATIKVTNPVTGEVSDYKNTFNYEVGERSVTVSPTKMNVFYIGVDNPIEISAAGMSSNDMNVSMGGSGGATINKVSDANYVVRATKPTAKGQFATVNVSGGGLSVSKEFRVKRIPDPVPMIGKKKGGSMPSGEFKLYSSLRAGLESFDFDAKCDIVGFRMVRAIKRNDPEISVNRGGKYIPATAAIAQRAKAGDRFFFENIKCKCPGDNAPRDIGSLGILIK